MEGNHITAICHGDLISLFVDNAGYFSCSGFYQPLPERSDTTSHLRTICCNGVQDLPHDFNTRCTFQIVGEKNQITRSKVCYGSYIRLIHHATGLMVVGSGDSDTHDETNPYKCTYLRNQLTGQENLAVQWQVLSRYRLRNEGDAVGENDFIVLRNVAYKDHYLTSVPVPNGSEHLIGLQRDSAFDKLGWQVRLLLSYSVSHPKEPSTEQGTSLKSKKHPDTSVISGSFVRLVHQELQGCLVCRHDDGALLSATLAPLGQVCHKLANPPSESLGVYVRAKSIISDPRSASSVWEILPRNRSKLGPLTAGDGIMLRHLLTGQYLCVRRPHQGDTNVIRNGSRNSITIPLMTVASLVSVATTSFADDTTIFTVHSVDISDRASAIKEIKYNENVYFVHEQTKAIIEIKYLGDHRQRMRTNTATATAYCSDDSDSEASAEGLDENIGDEWEDYIEDTPLRPCSLSSGMAVLSEAYKIVQVTPQEVKDILYVSRFLPLTNAAMALIQHTPRMDEVYLPLFRHLNVALYSLVEWVANRYDSDGALLMHPSLATITSPDTTREGSSSHLVRRDPSSLSLPSSTKGTVKRQFPESLKSDFKLDINSEYAKCSTMSPWIGRGIPPYMAASIAEPIVSDRDPSARPPSKINTFRQNLISDSRLLDTLLFITTVVFRAMKQYMLSLEDGMSHTTDVDNKLKVPTLVTGSCVLIHDLIYGCVVQNRRNSVRLLAVKDTLVSLMDQEILGWRPPVETLLISLQSKKVGTVLRESDTFSPTSVFSSDDINNLIKKTYDLYMSSKESAVHLLDLLTTLCAPGKLADKTFQDLITRTVFSTSKQRKRRISKTTSSMFNTTNKKHFHEEMENHSLFFSTRRHKGNWEVHFRVNAKFDLGNFAVNDEKREANVWAEMQGLKYMFLSALELPESHPNVFEQRLSVKQAITVLEQLGLGGFALCKEAGILYNANFQKFVRWFWAKRKVYFPSPIPALNHMTVGEAMYIIDNDSSRSLGVEDAVLDKLRDHSDDEGEDPDRSLELVNTKHNSVVNRALGLRRLQSNEDDGKEAASREVDGELLTPMDDAEDNSLGSDANRDTVGEIVTDWRNTTKFDQPLLRKMLMHRVPSFDIGEFDNFRPIDGKRAVGLDKSEMAHLGVFLRSSWFKTKKTMLQQKRIASQNWMPIDAALKLSSFESQWFRKALVLLAELCRGKNNVSQASVSEILPASLLLQILEHGKPSDKTIVCNLLLNVYVEHDLVFAPIASTCSNTGICSIDTLKLETRFEYGKVFGHITRMYQSDDEPKGKLLRHLLWTYIRRDMMALSLIDSTPEESGYFVVLLKMVRQLLSLGFFNDSSSFAVDSDIAESTSLGIVQENMSNALHSITSLFTASSGLFDSAYIEKILLEKILNLMHTHRTEKQRVYQGVVDSMSRDVELNRLSVEEFDILYHRVASLANSGLALGIRFMTYISDYFSNIFTNTGHMDMIVEILSVLEVTGDMTRLQQTAQIIGLLERPQSFFPGYVISLVVSRPSHRHVPPAIKMPIILDRKISSILSGVTRGNDKYTEALFATTLYHDNDIKRRAYKLLCMRLTNKLDVCSMLDRTPVVVHGEEEIATRMTRYFQTVLSKYEAEILAHEFIGDSVAIVKSIKYCFEALTYLAKNPFIHNTRPIGFPEDQFTHFISSQLHFYHEEITSSDAVDPSGGIQMIHNDYSSRLQWEHSYRNNIDATIDFCFYSDIPSRLQSAHVFERLVDSYVDKMCGLIISEHSNSIKPWRTLHSNTQLLIDLIFTFCADIVTPYTAKNLYPLSHFVLEYVWDCDGAINVIVSICKYCDFIQAYDKRQTFLTTVFENLCNVNLSDERSAVVAVGSARIVSAIMSYTGESVAKKSCVNFVKDHVVTSANFSQYIQLTQATPSEYEIALHVEMLRILYFFMESLVDGSGAESGSDDGQSDDSNDHEGKLEEQLKVHYEALSESISVDFCNNVLSSPSAPLQIKRYIFTMSSRIHPTCTVPIYHYMATDLKGIGRLLTNSREYQEIGKLLPILPDLQEYIISCCSILLSAAYNIELFSVAETDGILDNAIQSRNTQLLKAKTDVSASEIGGVPSSLYFSCVLDIYAIVRMPVMKDVVDNIVAHASHFEIFTKTMGMAYWIFKSLHCEWLSSTYENRTIKGQLKACFTAICELRHNHQNAEAVAMFLTEDGIDLFKTSARAVLSTPSVASESPFSDLTVFFNKKLGFMPLLGIQEIRESSLYLTFRKNLHSTADFLCHGGDQLMERTSGEFNETSTLRKMTDFDKWLYGGGRYIKHVSSFLAAEAKPDGIANTFLHIMCDLLYNNVDDIRALKKPLKTRMAMVSTEVDRLRRLQNAFKSYGLCNLVLALVGRCNNLELNESFVLYLMPLGLKLGDSLMAAGNFDVKEELMETYKSSITMHDSHIKYFVTVLRNVLRGIVSVLDEYVIGVSVDPTSAFPTAQLKILVQIYRFCSNLCSGHFFKAKHFLRAQHKAGEPVDLVLDIAKSMNSLLQVFCNQIRYITFEPFYDRLAPCVWKSNPDVKRRFIAWHDTSARYALQCEIMIALVDGFQALTEITQGPCVENQPSALHAISLCPDILEYVGAMQLRTATTIVGGRRFGDRVIVWDGGNPYSFYRKYKTEMKNLGIFDDDPDSGAIRESLKLWASVKTMKQVTIDILGVDLELFHSIGRLLEQSCLRFLLALLEASTDFVTSSLCDKLDNEILLQNMENLYKLSFESRGSLKEYRTAATVSYLTLISTIASVNRVDDSGKLDDLLDNWKEEKSLEGFNTEKLVGSVELTTADGKIQRVYFPIPKFVRLFWPYPAVQKAKDIIVWNVNRESAEDKLADFYDKMKEMLHVMRRQERLRNVLTPPIHALVGGTNPLANQFSLIAAFKMRMMLFVLTVLFCMLFSYIQFREIYPFIQKQQPFFDYFWDWENRKSAIRFAQYGHVVLSGILFVRAVINSPAADVVYPIVISGSSNVYLLQLLSSILSFSRDFFLVFSSELWSLAVMGFSFLALYINPFWYAPILLDLVPQVRLMSFLLEAIKRNLGKIFYSLVMAIILLFIFSVVAFLFFENQYTLADRKACNDVISCFMLHVDFGLLSPPEWIGEGYIDPFMGKWFESKVYGKILSVLAGTTFNLIYIILFNLVLQAIISGFIVDTFGAMRSEQEIIEEDIKARCFMCSIDRDDFEQMDIPYNDHVKFEHNMWHYLWFWIHLESKDPLSYTGPEQYAFMNYATKNSFVRLGPIKKSLSIMRRVGKTKEELSLKDVLKAVHEHSNTIHHAIAMEEEARTTVRLRMEDHEANMRKLVLSTGGLQQFTEDMTHFMEQLDMRLSRMETTLATSTNSLTRRRANRSPRHEPSDHDDDSSDPSQLPLSGPELNYMSKRTPNNREVSNLPVRVLVRGLSGSSMGGVDKRSDSNRVMSNPKVSSRILKSVPSRTRVTDALLNDSSDDEDARSGSNGVTSPSNSSALTMIEHDASSREDKLLQSESSMSTSVLVRRQPPLLSTELASGDGDDSRPVNIGMGSNSSLDSDIFSDDGASVCSSHIGFSVMESRSCEFPNSVDPGGGIGVVVTEQFDFSPAPPSKDTIGTSESIPTTLLESESIQERYGDANTSTHPKEVTITTLPEEVKASSRLAIVSGAYGTRPVYTVQYSGSVLSSAHSLSPISRHSIINRFDSKLSDAEDPDRFSFCDSGDDATSVTDSPPGILYHAFSTDLSGDSGYDHTDSTPPDTVDRGEYSGCAFPPQSDVRDRGQSAAQQSRDPVESPRVRLYPDLDIDLDHLHEDSGEQLRDFGSPRPLFRVQYTESVVSDNDPPAGVSLDGIVRSSMDYVDQGPTAHTRQLHAPNEEPDDATPAQENGLEAQADWADSSHSLSDDSVPALIDGPDDTEWRLNTPDVLRSEMSDSDDYMADVRMAQDVERQYSDDFTDEIP